MIEKNSAKSLGKKRVSLILLVSLLVISLLFGIFIIYDNFRVDIKTYTFSSKEIPQSLSGYKIAHISDYHNRKSKMINDSVLESLRAESPDIIVFTGDAVDSENPDFKQSLSFMKSLQDIAQVYFVTGNHEHRLSLTHSKDYNAFISDIENVGVEILSGSTVEISGKDGKSIYLHGIIDPYFTECKPFEIDKATEDLCSELSLNEGYNILIAHHPEQMDVYERYGFDLVLAGHAHGGQVTIFGKPIKAPDQSGIPRYSQGLYEEGNTKMVISRGIGYSVFPVRVFCSSQLVYIELKSQ